MYQFLEKTVRYLSAVTYAIGSVAVGLMMLQVAMHVFFQYVFSYPLPGTILFVSNYYMVIVTFLCLAAVELKGGHISVDLVTGALSARVQRWLLALRYAVTFVIFSLLTWQSFIVAEAQRAAGSFEIEYDVKIAIWPSYYFVPLGTGLLAFAALVKLMGVCLNQPMDGQPDQSDFVRSVE